MCKRFSFKSTEKILEEQLDIPVTNTIRWSYNIAPTHHAYVILDDAPNRLQYITWGLIPAHSRDGKNEGRLINARKEGIAVSPSFRIPIRSRRCLVLADSFYCWQKDGLDEVPFRVTSQNERLMTLAGIWDIWYKEDYAIKSFSIITKPTTGPLKSIVPRMPVVLPDAAQRKMWLSEIPLSKVQSIIDHREEDDTYHFYKISSEVHSVKKNDPSLHHLVE